MTDAIQFQSHSGDQLHDSQKLKIETLLHRVWPEAHSGDDAVLDFPERWSGTWYVGWLKETPIASARTFSRVIRSQGGEHEVMALASVCVDPDYRGGGLGARVVRLAFGEVDDGRYDLSLYQTGVPEFYGKLGARIVDNRFWNATGEDTGKNPWWEPHIMIYPATAIWPEGPIDLNGPGY